jgi:hypothetical protein
MAPSARPKIETWMKAVGPAIACAASRMTATPQMMKKPTSGRLVPPSLKERTLCRTEAPPTRAPSFELYGEEARGGPPRWIVG